MAGGTRGTNTMAEAFQRILADISQIKAMPDADLEFLIGIETQLLQKLRAPVEKMVGQLDAGNGAGAPPDPMGDPMAGGAIPMDPSMGQPSMAGAGVPGMRQSPGPPNPDELRRMLGGSAG